MLRPSILFFALTALPSLADTPRVVTDIAPVHSLASRVMQGVGTPDLVIPPGASPHGYQLRPSDASALESADVVFWIGESLTPWMHDTLDTLARDARSVELIEAEGTTVLPMREEVVFAKDDHGDDHGHDHGHDHDHGQGDPHAWLDPDNAKVWLGIIAAELGAADPENAETYRANAAAAQVEIDATATQVAKTLAPLKDREFVVFHDAYQYFDTHFGLSIAGAISLGDATDPSAARVAEIRDHVAEDGVTCVFAEPQFNPGLIAAVLQGTAAKTAILDPLGAELETGPGFYTALLLQLADRIASCLAPA